MRYRVSYENFKKDLLEMLELGKPWFVKQFELDTIVKNNGVQTDAIRVEYSTEKSVVPTFNVSNMYDDYKQGSDMEEILGRVFGILIDDYRNNISFDVNDITPERAKECLTLRIINKEWNRELLNNVAYLEVADLVAVPRWEVQIGNQKGSFLLNREMQKKLCMTDNEILELAMKNAMSQEFVLRGISEVAGFPQFADEKEPLILTNSESMYGAIGLMNKNILAKAQEHFGEKLLFVLPSSTHEIILMPSSITEDPAYLKDIVESTNATTVDVRERLSDNVYGFFNGKLAICNTHAQVNDLLHDRIKHETQTIHRKMGR